MEVLCDPSSDNNDEDDDEEDLFGEDNSSDDDNDDGYLVDEETDNSGHFIEYNGEPLTFAKPTVSRTACKMEDPSNVCQFDKPLLIIHQETGKEQYFAKWLFKNRLSIVTADLQNLDELEKTKEIDGRECELLVSKMTKNEGKNNKYSCYERKIVKAYYVETSGLSLKSELERLGDFSGEKEPGKIASRLELMVSTALRAPNKDYSMQFKLKPSDFVLVEENFHDGCGFAPIKFFEDHLGRLAQSTGVIQVRIFGAKIGWYKGLLMKKPGINRIELPPSMRKVEKSNHKKSPNWVVLVIHRYFPSESCTMMGRALNPIQKDPPRRWVETNLKGLDENPMYWHLLQLNNVPDEVIQNYSDKCRDWGSRQHCYLVGVADPTGDLPKDTVFITGYGFVVSNDPQRVVTMKTLVTRFPCTEKRDLVCIKCVRSKPPSMTDDDWEFLQSLPFGMMVFAASNGTPIPHRIADGDLDGDLFLGLWVCINLSIVYHDLFHRLTMSTLSCSSPRRLCRMLFATMVMTMPQRLLLMLMKTTTLSF